MLQQDLISVIIPVYNTERYLADCLESVLGQSYTNLEVILVNDGSTDGSGDICDKYAKRDERIRVIHKENAGQAVARNVAIRQARGTFISFIDSDDWIEPNMYERAIHEFENTNNLSVVRFGFQYRYADGSKRLETCKYSAITLQGAEILSTYVQDDGMNALMCSSVYRRDIFVRSDSARERERERERELLYIEGIVHEDEMLSLSLSLMLSLSPQGQKVKIIQEVMYNYRQDIVSTVSQLTARHMQDMCYGFEQVRIYGATFPQTPWSVLDLKILCILRHYYGKWLRAGISLSDISNATKVLRCNINCHSLAIDRGKWLYKLFAWSPRLYHYVDRIYAPIVRRLGISSHYK